VNVQREEDRIVLGSKRAKCPKCNAPAAVHYATNGKAEIWHPPTDCCDWAQARERRFDAMRRQSDARAQAEHDARGRNPHQDCEAA